MLTKSLALMLTVTLTTAVAAELKAPFVLMDGTPVKLRLARNLSSANVHEGETIDLELVEDIRVNDTIVAAHGSPALATITAAKAKGRMGKGGKLDMNIDYIRLANGEKAALRAVRESAGAGSTGKMTGAMVATSLVVWPAAPFFLFMKGKDAVIPKGTEVMAYVQGDIRLDERKFGIAPAAEMPAPVAVSAKQGTPLTNTDVLILKKAGLSDPLVAAKIRQSPARYSLEATDLIELKRQGVSDLLLQAMIEAAK